MNIAVIQFPGSNTERETALALHRAGLTPIPFLWNEPEEKLRSCDGFIITGGFSYEDRSRAGVIASLDPLMNTIRDVSEQGKPILGICNGAQILIESGLVPGLPDYRLGAALTDNKRTQNEHVVGTGYYNTWTHLTLATRPERTAFTRALKPQDLLHIPFAHAEGRFLIPEPLLQELQERNQLVFQYCDSQGKIHPDFPVNPNGSVANLAALCNPAGNVMAMMPHPERTPKGEAVFASLRNALETKQTTVPVAAELAYQRKPAEILRYQKPEEAIEWLVDLVITDNEAVSVHNALSHSGIDVTVKRYTHWEIQFDDPQFLTKETEKTLQTSDELMNTNKERRLASLPAPGDHRRQLHFLVRAKSDMTGRRIRETLANRFNIQELKSVIHGILWSLETPEDTLESTAKRVLTSHILFNPLSHDCYAYTPGH